MSHGARGKTLGLMLLLGSLIAAGNVFAFSLTGTPPSTVKVGERYFWTPTVVGVNRDLLEFAYVNRPVWSNAYRSSGAIIGTPTVPGVYSGIRIMAGYGKNFYITPPFTITVLPAGGTGGSLRISGTPPAKSTVNNYYLFVPTVIAPSGAALSFSIKNKPSWARFNTSSGALFGIPPAGDAGTYSGIAIEVSDGSLTASLPTFSIVIDPASTTTAGSLTLSWAAPTSNTNGTPLTNLSSYIIRYGTSAGALNSQLVVPGSATEAEISSLSKGTWYFEMAAVNTQQVESQFSSAVSAVVN